MAVQAGAYYRISLYRGDGAEAPAIERQRELVTVLAERKGWVIAGEYVDQDVSAYSGKRRPAYERLLSDMASGAIDAVLVLDQDRLVRRTRELEAFIELADRTRVKLANVSGDLDLSTPDGRFKAKLLGNLAEYESDKKSLRQRRERAQAARKGRSHGGPRPYGWYREQDPQTGVWRGTLLVHAEEAARLRDAAERVLRGESVYTIARQWTRLGYETAQGAPGWSGQALRDVLTRPRNAGLRTYHPSDCCARRRTCPNVQEIDAADWEPLWERGMHNRLVSVLGKPVQKVVVESIPHLLSGMIVCECGGKMSTRTTKRNGKTAWRYVCVNRGAQCGTTSILADPLEEFMGEAVIVALAGGKLDEALARVRAADQRVADALQVIEDAGVQLEELARLWSQKAIGTSEWLAARESIEDRKRRAQASLDGLTRIPVLYGLQSGEDALRAEWAQRKVEQRRGILHSVIDHVVVRRTGGRKVHPSDRVDILWKV